MGLIEPVRTELIDNGAGWRLELRLYRDPATQVPGRRPLVFVPGYAMNAYILGYHPGGPSIVEHLVREGYEVWTANLRGQGGSTAIGRPSRWGLGELALDDLPAVVRHVREATTTGADKVDLLGCSLGASLVYTYLAHRPREHGVGAAVAIGGPLRWDKVHPLLKLAFASPALAGAVPFRGTRQLAALALPVLKRAPGVLSIYMNTAEIDLSAAEHLVPTVEDPVPWINRQIARWVQDKDLVVRGLNITEGLRDTRDVDVLAIVANRDGIVTPASASAVVDALPPGRVTLLDVGTAERWYAHADLFVGRRAREEVFAPLAAWLRDRNPA